jgi:hypothetical protein
MPICVHVISAWELDTELLHRDWRANTPRGKNEPEKKKDLRRGKKQNFKKKKELIKERNAFSI